MIYHLTSYIWSCMFDKHHLFLAWDGKYYNKLQDNAFHHCGWGLSCCTKKCDASELESSYEFGFRIKRARIELKLDFWRLKVLEALLRNSLLLFPGIFSEVYFPGLSVFLTAFGSELVVLRVEERFPRDGTVLKPIQLYFPLLHLTA